MIPAERVAYACFNPRKPTGPNDHREPGHRSNMGMIIRPIAPTGDHGGLASFKRAPKASSSTTSAPAGTKDMNATIKAGRPPRFDMTLDRSLSGPGRL